MEDILDKKADIQMHFDLGKAYLRRGRREDALREFRASLALAPDYADIYHELGVVYALTAKFEKAIKCFEKAIEINPNYIDPRINLAITLSDIGRDKEAMEHFKAVKSIEKNKIFLFGAAGAKIANAHSQLGDLYCDVEAFTQAIEEYKKGIGIASDFHDISLKLAKAYIAKGELNNAKTILEQVYKKDPKFTIAIKLLGSVYLKMGKREASKRIYLYILKQNPNDTEATVILDSLKSLEKND